MTKEGQMDRGKGERLHAERRRSFWTILAALAVLGAVIGFASGLFAAHADANGEWAPAWRVGTAIAIVAFTVLAAYGSWRFFRTVDELELADNLWGSLFGFYTYALLFPTWWAFGKLETVPQPDQWVIYAASMAVAALTYFYRKLRLR